MHQQHSHILQGRSQIASQSPTPPPSAAPPTDSNSESHTICKPMDLGSSRSSSPKLTQLCPNIMSRGDPMPAYQERTPHLPITTPSKTNRFIITQSFYLSKTSYSYGEKNNLHHGQRHHPALHRKAAGPSLFQGSLLAFQPFNMTAPTSTTCSAFPALASAAMALGSQKKKCPGIAWILPASNGVYSLRRSTIRHGWLQC